MNSAGSIQRKAKMDEIEDLPSTSRRCFDDIKVQFGNFKVKEWPELLAVVCRRE